MERIALTFLFLNDMSRIISIHSMYVGNWFWMMDVLFYRVIQDLGCTHSSWFSRNYRKNQLMLTLCVSNQLESDTGWGKSFWQPLLECIQCTRVEYQVSATFFLCLWWLLCPINVPPSSKNEWHFVCLIFWEFVRVSNIRVRAVSKAFFPKRHSVLSF